MKFSSQIRNLIVTLVILSPLYTVPDVRGAISLAIEKTRSSFQGQHQYVDVTVADGYQSIGGFDLLLAYDQSALSLIDVVPGVKFFSDSSYQWEYFVYRKSVLDSCQAICPTNLVRVTGIAETNNGQIHPSGYDMLTGDVLFTLDVLISDDRKLECTFSPIRFCWTDCEDNVLSTPIWADSALISRIVIDHNGDTISNSNSPLGYPTYTGGQDSDCIPENLFGIIDCAVDFINGGIDIACAESLENRCRISGRDDWYPENWQVADAILYSRYFIYGLGVFNLNRECQIAATDVNCDGNTLTVADLVYQFRIVTGDATAFPLLDTLSVNYVYHNDTLSLRDEVGALFVKFEGDVEPINLSNYEMSHYYDAQAEETRVLVYTIEKGAALSQEVLVCDSRISYLEMATYDAQPIAPKLISVPDSFELYQNYPNPFNSETVVTFGLPFESTYEVTIYNAVGQSVGSISGTAPAGTVSVEWDAGRFSSGVYFYRLKAGNFTDTKKMVLLK